MFGFAYSAMALGQFLTSALWGKVGDKIGYSKAIALGFFGYAFSALVFSMAKGPTLVIAGRFIAGCVVSSIQVNSMATLPALTHLWKKETAFWFFTHHCSLYAVHSASS